ncbi:MAG: hypothetical protein ACLFWL_00460 [Candidatus Brocadiia bacterium]
MDLTYCDECCARNYSVESRVGENHTHGLDCGRKPIAATRRGFLLIVLLVVIAIIAILAAMLMPALERAREAAKTTVCLNQQKQIFLGIMFYAEDNESYLPDNYHWLCDRRLHGNPDNPKGFGLLGNYVRFEMQYCPAGKYSRTGYWGNRQAGYCYHVPAVYSTGHGSGGAKQKSRRLPIPWWPLNACRVDGNTPLPHGDRGITILRRGGSAFFLKAPPWGGWGYSWDPYSSAKNWDHYSLLWDDERIVP